MQLGPYPLTYLRLDRLAAAWPDTSPLLCLAGSGRYGIVALCWREVGWSEVAALPLTGGSERGDTLPFARGYIGLVPYDLYAPNPLGDAIAQPRVFRVEQALVHDRHTGMLHVTGSPCTQAGFVLVDGPSVIAKLLLGSEPPPHPEGPLTLTASGSDLAYEQLVRDVLGDIRSGRYYQLNLLRYFTAAQVPSRRWIGARLDRFGGDFTAWFSLPDLQVISFSPERFVCCALHGDDTMIRAFPIKGTAARHLYDPLADAAIAAALQHSAKDLAELHMIVDLMRHDLYGASVPRSIRVLHSGRLLTLASVHHLEAEICASLRLGITIGELLAAVCPGGSITGAPKQEVMLAIREYEGRPRGYFMGHAFHAADGGGFDASILIRTLVQRGDDAAEFAAGGGLVIGSDPASERREIAAKCRVVTLD